MRIGNYLTVLKEGLMGIFKSAETLVPPEIKNYDPFLMWLNDILGEFIAAEPDVDVKQHISSLRRIFFAITDRDEYYRLTSIRLVLLIRNAPAPPIHDFERKLKMIERKWENDRERRKAKTQAGQPQKTPPSR